MAFRPSFRFKTIAGLALLQGLLLAVLLAFGAQQIRGVGIDEVEKRSATTLALAKAMTLDAIFSSDIAALQDFADQVAAITGVAYVRVFAHDKLVASAGDPAQLQRPFQADRNFDAIDDGVIDAATTITLEGIDYGRIELGVSTAAVQATVTRGVRNGALFAIGAIALVAIFSWLFGSYLTRQLQELKRGAELLEAGQYGEVIPIRGQDELAESARAFNAMSVRVAQAHRELTESQERYKAVFDTAVAGIVTTDDKGVIQSANPAAAALFGYSVDDLIGRSAFEVIEPSGSDKRELGLQAYLQPPDGKIQGIAQEIIGRRRDDSRFPLKLSVARFYIGDQQMYTAMMHDVTKEKKADRAKRDFVATVSHELRTPLTAIRGSLGLLAGTFSKIQPDRVHEMLRIAVSNCDRLTLLVNDLLDLEKMESGAFTLECVPMDLSEIAQEAIKANEGFAQHHRVALTLQDDVQHAPVVGDHARLLQVFANLVSNAVKYSPSGGTVVIGLRRAEEGFRVTVQDQGPGIPAEFRERIFSRFAQADSSDTKQKGGTGLGLCISKAIIEQHGGQIDFETEIGQGTVFYFDLPCAPEGQRMQVRPDPGTDGSLPTMKLNGL